MYPCCAAHAGSTACCPATSAEPNAWKARDALSALCSSADAGHAMLASCAAGSQRDTAAEPSASRLKHAWRFCTSHCNLAHAYRCAGMCSAFPRTLPPCAAARQADTA